MTLEHLQAGFLSHILAPHAASFPALSGQGDKGLAVYRHAYRAQLVSALRDTYEHTALWLGDDAFERAALAYAQATPSASWTLNTYGAGFGAWLAPLWPDDPDVTELAWLEWHLRRAFDGPDSPAFDPSALADIAWDAASFRMSPTLAWAQITTNCAAIRNALAEGETPPPAQRLPETAGLRVWRRGLNPMFRTIERMELALLAAAHAGQTLGGLCIAAEAFDADAEAVGLILADWFADGVIVGVDQAV